MKVKIIGTGTIIEAKRFKDFTDEEIKNNTEMPEMWEGDEIFIKNTDGEPTSHLYMFDSEVEIIEE